MEGGESIPAGGPWKHPAELRRRVCSKALGPLGCLDFQCTNSARSLQAAGSAKGLTQTSYISSVTSLSDRGNLKNIDVPRSLFHKMVLIDADDNSQLQTFIDRTRLQPFHPSAQD